MKKKKFKKRDFIDLVTKAVSCRKSACGCYRKNIAAPNYLLDALPKVKQQYKLDYTFKGNNKNNFDMGIFDLFITTKKYKFSIHCDYGSVMDCKYKKDNNPTKKMSVWGQNLNSLKFN